MCVGGGGYVWKEGLIIFHVGIVRGVFVFASVLTFTI